MVRRFFLVAGLLAVALAGCKQSSGKLVAQTATTALDASLFAAPNNVQTLSFTSGGARDAKPYALVNFLYAKHWLACASTEPGPFSQQSVCTFQPAGRAYAHANGWTAVRPSNGCAACETWSVPVATAKLQHVTAVEGDKTHATATYAYEVVPTELGLQLMDWMAKNPIAWCGPIPSASGGWSKPRTSDAQFAHTGTSWQLAQPAAGFDATFADPGASKTSADRPCSNA